MLEKFKQGDNKNIAFLACYLAFLGRNRQICPSYPCSTKVGTADCTGKRREVLDGAVVVEGIIVEDGVVDESVAEDSVTEDCATEDRVEDREPVVEVEETDVTFTEMFVIQSQVPSNASISNILGIYFFSFLI